MALIYSSDKNTATAQGFDASQHKHSLELLPLSLYPCLAQLHKSWCGDKSHLFDDLCCGYQSKAVVVNPDIKELSVVHIRDGHIVDNHFRMRNAKPAEWEMIQQAMEILDNERPTRTHFPSSEHPRLLADLKTSFCGTGSQICGRSDCVEVLGGVIPNTKTKEVSLHHSCDESEVRNHHKMTTTKLTAWQAVEEAMDERYGRKLSELGKKLGGNGNVYFGRCGPAARPVNMLRSLNITVRGMEQEKKHGAMEQTVNHAGIFEPRFELGSAGPESHKDIPLTPKTAHQSQFKFWLPPPSKHRGFFAPHTATRPDLVMENQPQHHSQHNKPGLQQPVSARSPQPASQYQNVFEFRFPSGRDSLQSHTGLRSSPNSSTEANDSENEMMNETKDASDAKPARKWTTTYKIDFSQAKQRLRDSEYRAVAEDFNSLNRARGPLHFEYLKRSETTGLSTLCGCINFPSSCQHYYPLESPPHQQPTPVQSTSISCQSHISNLPLSEGATSDSVDEYETDSEPEIITSRPASPKPDSRGPIQREDGEWDLVSDFAQDPSYPGSRSSGSSESDFVEITDVRTDSHTGM